LTAARLRREDSRCVPATSKSRRSSAADDNRPLTDGNKNGMNAADSVMKAAAKRTTADRSALEYAVRERAPPASACHPSAEANCQRLVIYRGERSRRTGPNPRRSGRTRDRGANPRRTARYTVCR
jgi:hypothetical protein